MGRPLTIYQYPTPKHQQATQQIDSVKGLNLS